MANWMGMAMKFDYEAAVTRRLFDVVALPFADLANRPGDRLLRRRGCRRSSTRLESERESERNAREVPSVCDPVGETVYGWTRATGWQLIHGTGAAQSASGRARPTGERAFPFLPRFPS